MKSFYYILLFLGMPFWLLAQSSTQNYIVTTVPYQAVSDPTTLTDANSSSNSNSSVQYFDGLGRPVQTVQKAITSSGKDLVNFTEYDAAGREYKHWLPAPATGNTGVYVNPIDFIALANTQYTSSEKPYATTEYEPSQLNRVTGQYGAGADWYNNTKKKVIAYTTNGADVKHYYVDGTQLKCDGFYGAATLFGQKTTDEDGKTVEEFTDKQGRKVLSRTADSNDTYYVYDDIDNLRYVLPPLAADALGTSTSGFGEGTGTPLDQYGYIYHYDGRNRCTEKKLPGCDWIHMVYDLADRLILSQDGNQRLKAQWTVNKYDSFKRLLYSGLINDGSSRSGMEANYSGSVTNESYTGSGPVAGYTSTNLTPSTLLTVNYYDNYSFLSYSGNNPGNMLTKTTLSDYDNPDLDHTKTLLTGTRVYHLDNPSLFETTALYYDKYGRVVQTRATNHLGGYDIAYNALDFIGKPTRTYKTHGINGASTTITELYTYGYNKAQQPTTTMYSLNGGSTVTLSVYNYDELGRVSAKILGSVDATTYAYNVRSWTKDITGSRFSENLYYNANTVGLPNFTPAYNGNIAGMKWNVANENLGYQRAYSFDYDDLNRLTNSVYSGNNGSGTVSGTLDKYNEVIDYQNDKMGNIHGITRYENGAVVESLSLSYIGNQLQNVDNSQNHFVAYGSELFRDYDKHIAIPREYAYDTNGNMLYDANGGVSDIEYNVLNLPDKTHFTAGHKNLYTYNASGQKLRVVNYSSNRILDIPMGTITPLSSIPSDYTVLTTDYVGNMIYENGALKEILLPEGYYQNGTFYYYLKDHLGDNRVTINSSGAVVEKSHYYPSGTRFFTESTSNSAAIPYRYNGKEMETMNGLNQMDYGARRRFSWAPIWTGVDPLAEKRPWMSPYVYCSDNPLNRIDPDGRLDAPLNGTQVYKMHNLVSVDLDHKYRAQGGSLGNDPSITYNYAFRSVGINAKNSSQLAAENNGTLITVNSEFFKIRNVGSSPHVGTDYLAKYGSNVYSYGDGSIVSTGENSAGKFVTVKYGNGDVVNFMHLSETGSFKVGENIYEGQILGQSGTYGGGPHLHVSAVNSSGELIDVTSRNYGTVSNSEFFTTYGGNYLNLKTAKEANQNTSPTLAPPNITQQQDNTKLKNNSMGGW